MPGLVPSPDLRNICLQLKQLTAPELAYVRHYLAQILDEDDDQEDEPGGGVREPRRPIRPRGDAYAENAEQARAAIESSPAWLRHTATPPRSHTA